MSMPIYAYCDTHKDECQNGADAAIVLIFVERDLVNDLQLPQVIYLTDHTFEDETVRPKCSVDLIKVFSNTLPPLRYFCPYSIARSEAANFYIPVVWKAKRGQPGCLKNTYLN